MRYYKVLNEEGQLILIGTGPGGIEISEEEYNKLLDQLIAEYEFLITQKEPTEE